MIRLKFIWRTAVLSAVFLTMALSVGVWESDAQAVDFSGERITVIVPFSEGGGTDVYARFLVPLLREHLPGKPTMLIRNIPGAGSIAGANQFQERAKPDGLTVMGVSTSTITNYALKDPRAKYRLDTWNPIILSPLGAVVYGRAEIGVKLGDSPKTIVEKLKAYRLVYGGQSITSGDIRPNISLAMLGIKPKTVWGLKGRGPPRLAFERGEFNINYDTAQAYTKRVVPMIEAGKATPLFSFGFVDDDGNMIRDPLFPDLPHFAEVYEGYWGKKPSGPDWKAWFAFFNMGTMASKSLHLPAGTPQDIIDTYRKAAVDMMASAEYKKAATKVVGEYPQALGKQAKRIILDAATIPPDAKAWLDKWLKEEHNTEL